MSRFCALYEVVKKSEACDPVELCRNLTPNIVKAFLYWMCIQSTLRKLDSLLSHGQYWWMAVKYKAQCNVPDFIAQDMSLVRFWK